MNRLLLGIWALRTPLVRTQKEVQNMLLELQEGGESLCDGRKLRKIVTCSYVRSRVCDQLGYIAKGVSKQSVE